MKELPLTAADVSVLSNSLRKISFFKDLSLGSLERFIRITHLYDFPGGATVFRKGDVGDALYVVHSGHVRVRRRAFPLWPARTLATLGAGDLFGEMALLDQPYRTATVVTEGATKLFVILNTHFNELLHSNPEFARSLRDIAQQRTFETRHR